MSTGGHLWAVGFDRMERAQEVRAEIARLGASHRLILLDSAVAVRYPDGSLAVDGEPFVAAIKLTPARTFASFLAGLALGAPPLTGAAVAAVAGRTGSAAADVGIGIGNEFICEVEALVKPGTSALFVLDQAGDMDAILQGIRGLGGTVLKTNVNLERAKLIQATLTGGAAEDR
jgi:uncharacterized membrane protein